MGPAMQKNDLQENFSTAAATARLLLGGALAAAIALQAFTSTASAEVYGFAQLAGNGSVLDHTDGTGGNARFFNPTSVAVDGSGNVYVADGGDHTIRKVTPGGVATTLAGSSGQAGSSDGTGSGALFLYPYAVAVDGSGNVYVADSGNNNIRKVTPAGSVSTLAGNAGLTGSADGTGSAALFNAPKGIAVDTAGNVYVSDTDNSTLRKVTAAGVVTTLAGAAGQTGSADGAGASARLSYPAGLAVDSSGNVYVADFDNSTIRKVSPGGSVSTFAGSAGVSGSADGQGGAAQFNHPSGVTVDGAGNVYVIDTSNQTVREISPGGSVSTLAGTPGIGGHADGTGAAARFFYPAGIASTASGTVYIADTGNHSIRAMDSPGVVGTLAGSVGIEGSANGTGSQALFSYPCGIANAGSGFLYVADTNNNLIREVTTGGEVTTLAGSAGLPGSADGAGAAAQFNSPTAVAVDGNGNVYVADQGNSTVRKVSPGGSVTTFAGLAGSAGSSDGTGAAARFNAPMGVAVDSVGNVYVADTKNNTIRKITAGGTVTTLAGVAGQTGSGDGAGGSARFNGPYAVAVDASGNVYVADYFNATIRKINASNTVSTLAGTAGQMGFADGTGFAAKFNEPSALTVDGSGNVYVADTYNRAVREISPSGAVTTLNGAQTRFYYPQGIAVDASGNLYVVDGDNQAINAGGGIVAPPSGASVPSQSVSSGSNASFTVAAPGADTTFQWQMSADSGATWANVDNSATFSGATTATLAVTDPSLSMNGDEFRVQLANPAGSSVSSTATLTVTTSGSIGGPPTGNARIINLSIRSYVGTGASLVTVGFAISGTSSKQLLIRADGPTLASFGVGGVLANPSLSIFNSSQVMIDTDTAWGGSASLSNVFAALGAFALPPASADSALFLPLAGGSSYTAEVTGVNGTTGVALAELYDADSGNPPTRLINVSARALAGTGSSVLTAGFVIGGNGTETVLIRGIGPGLTQYGVSGVLATPKITLFDSSGTAIGSNTGWGGGSALASAFAQVGAFPLPAGSADSAMLVTLPSGLYTVEVVGADGSSGIALVEVYEVN
jgi:sugar lactone lactonase YvrE